MRSVIAVDVGSSMIKAVRVADTGEVLSEAHRPAPGDSPVSPQAVWEATASALNQIAVPGIEAVVVAGQGDGLWRLNRDGEALPAYLWNSTEAAEVVSGWERDGTIKRYFDATGTTLWPGASGAIWRWLQAESPEQLAQTRVVWAAKDWVNYCLTGEVATDFTDATIPFLDPHTSRYSTELAELLGLPHEILDVLPTPKLAGELLGEVSSAAAEATGLDQGTPVYQGCIDVAAMAGGLGIGVDSGPLCVLGTTAVAISITSGFPQLAEPAGAVLSYGDGRFMRVLGSTAGTSTLEWFLGLHGYTGADRYDRFWRDCLAAATEVQLLPFLRGERAPFIAPQASGVYWGLRAESGLPDLAQATAEGITYALQHNLTALEASPAQLVLTGGGATSAHWCQLVADVTGAEVLVDQRPHPGAIGAAALVPGFDQLPEVGVDNRRAFHPGPGRERQLHRYATYLSLVENALEHWRKQ